MPDLIYTIFFFALGACIGSFLNVVVWRLPRVELEPGTGFWREFIASFHALSNPPSHCPKCGNRLKWYDNIPILGWIKLGGKCRFCKQPISPRYPIVEAVTACLFAFYYIAFYVWQWRTCCPQPRLGPMIYDPFGVGHAASISQWILGDSWPIFALYLILIAGLLAASLIDAELFIIPTQIPWIIAVLAFGIHAAADRPWVPGSLNLIGDFGRPAAALAAGAGVGLALSMILWARGILPTSFPEGEPLLEVDRQAIAAEIERAQQAGEPLPDESPLPPSFTPKQIRSEMQKEIIFLLPPLALGAAWLSLTMFVPLIHDFWAGLMQYDWLTGLSGALLGAMIGAFVVWVTRILGTLAFGRVAMGLGDVHLMFGVGAVIGAGAATVAFFLAPFFGIVIAIYMLLTRKGREMPLGPYLSLATAFVMLAYCPIAAYLSPGLQGLALLLGGGFGHG
jgi:leader peptidase (prepilin peptidase)/N-methyltransferase